MIFAGMRSIGGKGNSDVAHPRNWCWIPSDLGGLWHQGAWVRPRAWGVLRTRSVPTHGGFPLQNPPYLQISHYNQSYPIPKFDRLNPHFWTNPLYTLILLFHVLHLFFEVPTVADQIPLKLAMFGHTQLFLDNPSYFQLHSISCQYIPLHLICFPPLLSTPTVIRLHCLQFT